MALITDISGDFKKMAPGIETAARKAELSLQLAEYIDAINKILLASNITLRLQMRTEGDDHHLSFRQFGREQPYAMIRFDPKKEEARFAADGKRPERLDFETFKKRLIEDLFTRLDAEERARFGAGFQTVIAQLERPKALHGPA